MIRRQLAATLEEPDRPIEAWKAEVNGELAGVAVIQQDEDGIWELTLLGVSVHHQRQGIGRRLAVLAVTSDRAADSGVVDVLVDFANKPMLKLVDELGGVKSATRVDWNWEHFRLDPIELIQRFGRPFESAGRQSGDLASDHSIDR